MARRSHKPTRATRYNQHITGFYGEFGSRADAQIYFLQSGFKPTAIERVTLIGQIPGAECWSVRDLFQREVDNDRVTTHILPYFKSKDMVKFFNSLTLTILPICSETGEILVQIPRIKKKEQKVDDIQWIELEYQGYYRYRYMKEEPDYGTLEWADSKVKLVAIDGQHRLSALKRLYKDPERSPESLNWTIPVVILGIRGTEETPDNATILDITRSIFVYINKTAKKLNRCREILLNDESINCVCAQELLEYSHENDIKDSEDRNRNRLPLLFFDWRGAEEGEQRKVSPGSLKVLEEIHDWFEWYLLGKDFEAKQKEALGLQPVDKLQQAFVKGRLSANISKEARKVFRKRVLKGLTHLLENFIPYRQFISQIRSVEECWNAKSDNARHAFYDIRFGNNLAGDDQQRHIASLKEKIVEEIEESCAGLPPLLGDDIGMRGVMCAFGRLRRYYGVCHGETPSDWLKYARWFTRNLNLVYEDHWLDGEDKTKHRLLKHLTYDHNDSRVNYRLDHANRALGSVVGLLVAAHGKKGNKEQWYKLRDDTLDILSDTLWRGYKKESRVLLRDNFAKDPAGLKKAVEKRTRSETRKHIDKLSKALEEIETRRK